MKIKLERHQGKKFGIRKFPELKYVLPQYRDKRSEKWEAILINLWHKNLWIFRTKEIYNNWPKCA